jgi:hypothetical protein
MGNVLSLVAEADAGGCLIGIGTARQTSERCPCKALAPAPDDLGFARRKIASQGKAVFNPSQYIDSRVVSQHMLEGVIQALCQLLAGCMFQACRYRCGRVTPGQHPKTTVHVVDVSFHIR